MADKITVKSALEAILPELVEAVGETRTRAIIRETANRMGEGGTVTEWLSMWAQVIAEGGNQREADAFLRRMDRLMAA